MPAEVRFLEIPGLTTVALNHPAYFDYTRPLSLPGALARWTHRGWVLVWPDNTDPDNIVQVVLRQDRGELMSDDGDVWLPNERSIFAEPKEQFEAWTLAKACFEHSRPWLAPLTEWRIPAFLLDEWRMNVHWEDWMDAPVVVRCLGKCLLRDIKLDRYFRAAWEATDLDPRAIRINMGWARQVHMDNIRRVRDWQLSQLDMPFMRALETGDKLTQAKLAALKQRLRHIPESFHLTGFKTPEALKAAWPVGLSRPAV